jgi:alkanesulfonate monooxygenase SsuD/methylene tetrahydromethanopterin reductase-like flavin-dependent oxidoreductase (luciferase family)
MRLGAVIPLGGAGDFDGWDSRRAWTTITHLARDADEYGLESIWTTDHFHTVPRPIDELTFESFSTLSALAAITRRVRLGHLVMCAGYRNPALVAKMISTLDVISGGRMEIGIGAGWKRDEYVAYGYPYPNARDRLALLEDQLEVMRRMLRPGRAKHATFAGTLAQVHDAINVPKPIQPRVPLMVGGNGREVTWRIAARHADELNLDALSSAEVAAALPVIRDRCQEIGRDPSSLKVSVSVWWGADFVGRQRVKELSEYRSLGLSRMMVMVHPGERPVAQLATDALAAGLEITQN